MSGIDIFNYLNGKNNAKGASYRLLKPTDYKFVAEEEVFPISSLIIKNNKLYAKVRSDYCYLLGKMVWSHKDKLSVISESDDDDIYYGACVNSYYLLGDGEIIKGLADFKGYFLKEANRYSEIINARNFGENKIQWGEKEDVVKNDWLSPLLSRTLNLIFAGEGKKAWQEFSEDFGKFSKKYPLLYQEQLDPQKIKEDIQKQLEKQ